MSDDGPAEQIAAADGGPFIGFPRYHAQQAAAAELWRSAVKSEAAVVLKCSDGVEWLLAQEQRSEYLAEPAVAVDGGPFSRFRV